MAKLKVSKDTDALVERILNKNELKYDAALHLRLLVELFSQGHDISAFCVASEIGRRTFFEWIEKHAEFKCAYEKAREMAHQWWLEYGRRGMEDPAFNSQMWGKMMGNRFRYADQRRVEVEKLKDASSVEDAYNILKQEIINGALTTNELSQLTKFIETGIRIMETMKFASEIENIKTELQMRKH